MLKLTTTNNHSMGEVQDKAQDQLHQCTHALEAGNDLSGKKKSDNHWEILPVDIKMVGICWSNRGGAMLIVGCSCLHGDN